VILSTVFSRACSLTRSFSVAGGSALNAASLGAKMVIGPVRNAARLVPQIGELALVDGKALLIRTILLKGPRRLGGHPYSGRPPHDTAEVINDVNVTSANGGVPVPVEKDSVGYDSEGFAGEQPLRLCAGRPNSRPMPASFFVWQASARHGCMPL